MRAICDRHGILFISDEVICAYGRLGTMFGHQKYDYVPDIVTMAKGLSSGYQPIGGCLVRDEIADGPVPYDCGGEYDDAVESTITVRSIFGGICEVKAAS